MFFILSEINFFYFRYYFIITVSKEWKSQKYVMDITRNEVKNSGRNFKEKYNSNMKKLVT